ncbi:MAG: 23S rRNA (uracil(1939)-C(5))-methyltransferase RlmD [Ruminococcaceae bacterium]|nr:23S rRNA (uracil(1939)-C(5))-methyltransferase RlmD [Oscillospiraceae bacterium]
MELNFTCTSYKKCGGCQLDVPYKQQLSYKQKTIIKMLGRYCRVSHIIGMENPNNYRCKVSAAFGYTRGQVICGVWQSSSGKIVQVGQCNLEDERAASIIKTIKRLLPVFNLRTYDEVSQKGFLRFVTVRVGKATGEILVALGTGNGKFPAKKDFVNALVRECPYITTVTQNVSTDKLNLMLGKKENVLYGRGFVTDNLCGRSFCISARSFFQINPIQTEKLYSIAVDFAGLDGTQTVIDAYCGVGTIGIIAASKAKKVTAVELNSDAAKNALENVKLNGIENMDVLTGDAGEFMKKMAKNGEKADVVFTDPPRAGCTKQFLKSLIELAPQKIVYVSCNPETLSRDLYFLTNNGYSAEKIQPVDMFPNTKHVECVVQLSRKEH